MDQTRAVVVSSVPFYLVLEAGHAEEEQVQQAVELGHRQVCEPLLQHHLVGVLQHPQQADQQAAAGLGREGPVLSARLGKGRRGGGRGRGGQRVSTPLSALFQCVEHSKENR